MSALAKRELIYGLLDADGGWQQDEKGTSSGWRLSLSNKRLMRQVHMLCQQTGFSVSDEIETINRPGRAIAYRIWVTSEPTDEPVSYEHVIEVEEAGEGETYDLEVEDDLHNFVANGIVSHNTLTQDAMLMARLRKMPDRKAFMIDVGQVEDSAAMDMVNRWRKIFRKHEFIDPACVLLSQKVKTVDGDKTLNEIIADFTAGKETHVYSYDKSTGRPMVGKVTWAGVTRKQAEVVEVVIEDGTVIVCTPDHPIGVLNTEANIVKWTPAVELTQGDRLSSLKQRDPSPNHRVVAVRRLTYREDTGDLTVALYHNFFVADAGNGGVLVHNSPDYKKQYNPLMAMDDIWIPIRGSENSTKIEDLSGTSTIDEAFDLETFIRVFCGAARIPKTYLGWGDGEINGRCLNLRTKIDCLDGKSRTLRSIIDRYQQTGKLPWVYSVDAGGKIVPGRVQWAGVTRRKAQQVVVTLDSRRKIRCTPDHKFMLQDGSYQEASKLRAGESLFAIPKRISDGSDRNQILKGYEQILEPSGAWIYTHRMVIRGRGVEYNPKKGEVIHHDNEVKLNNDPDNLKVVHRRFHGKLHRKNVLKLIEFHSDPIRHAESEAKRMASCRTPEYRARKSRLMTAQLLDENSKLRKWVKSSANKGAGDLLKNWRLKNKAISHRTSQMGGYRAARKNWANAEFRKMHSDLFKGKNNPRFRADVTLDSIESAPTFDTVAQLLRHLKIDRRGLVRVVRDAGYDYVTYLQSQGYQLRNHKVKSVEFIEAREDTGDITVETHSNFLLSAGIVVHNSTLGQMDVRFARTIKMVRRAILYGYRSVLDIHYTLLNTGKAGEEYDYTKNPYLVQMAPISYLDEYERLELIQLRFALIEAMAGLGASLNFDPKVWALYLLLNYAKIPEEIAMKLVANRPPPQSEMPQSGQSSAGGNGNGSGGISDRAIPRRVATLIQETAAKVGVDPRTVVGNIGTEGYTQLSEDEKRAMLKCFETSPLLRKTIGNLVEYTDGDLAIMQTDPSMLPATEGGRSLLVEDDYADDPEKAILERDLSELRDRQQKLEEE